MIGAVDDRIADRAFELATLINTDAEHALLGAILIQNRAYDRVVDLVRAEDFGNAVHARIFHAIGTLIDKGQTANPVTLKPIFDHDEALKEIGAARYLARLAGAAVTIINAEDYACHIADLARRREIVAVCEAAKTSAVQVAFDRTAENVIEDHLAQLGSIRRVRKAVGIDLLSLDGWLTRDIPEPDFLLGELLSTTCRLALIGPTGIGKSNFLLGTSFAVADGRDFLHWRGAGNPRRVLYVDGEMSRRLARRRLEDAVRRHGGQSSTFNYLNREDFSDLAPLNKEAGQRFIDDIVEAIGGVDLIVFDNVQSLLAGDMKDEEPWQQTLPWIRDLTRRGIGQIWAHHTGHDKSHGYGSKTREWQLDTVALMEWAERPGTDIAFNLKFTKARECSPDNRSDFEPAAIMLANDEWIFERTPAASRRKKTQNDLVHRCNRMIQ